MSYHLNDFALDVIYHMEITVGDTQIREMYSVNRHTIRNQLKHVITIFPKTVPQNTQKPQKNDSAE